MNGYHVNHIGMPLIALAACVIVSCSQDTVSPSEQVTEEYTKNFIKEFGIPAAGHDFSMATSAGLQVKTSQPAHITVTADVDGKEYLFADLTVPAGTTPVPVTVPRSVTSLKIKTGNKTLNVSVNDVVDIDNDVPNSRAWIVKGYDYDENLTPYMTGLSSDGIDQPIIAFRPGDLLDRYFESHPIGAQNSTDYYYQGCDKGEGYFDFEADPHSHLFFGETCMGAYCSDFMIFPIWWKRNAAGNKNYALYLHEAYSSDLYNLPFNDPTSQSNPFPDLKYYTGDISRFFFSENDYDGPTSEPGFYINGNESDYYFLDGDLVYDKLVAGMDNFITSSGDNAYSIDEASLVVSKGLRVKFNAYDYYGEFGLGMCLVSDGQDGNSDYCFTMPAWNREFWGDNYFDENLNHLFFPYVSTMQFPLSDIFWQGEGEPAFPDPKIEIWQKVDKSRESLSRVFFSSSSISEDDKGSSYKNGAFLVGFSTPAQKPADCETVRDYADFIMLVVPMGYLHLVYQASGYPDPYVWTMAVEDLGGTDDWDFNDAVFHFTDVVSNLNSVNMNNLLTSAEGPNDAVTVRLITVWPEATGGTLPIYVTFTGTAAAVDIPSWGADKMYSDVNNSIMNSLYNAQSGTFVLGTELHKWLGASSFNQFVNVGDKRTGATGRSVQFAIPVGEILGYSSDNTYGSENNKPLYGFSLLVDRENNVGIDAFNEEDNGFRFLSDIKLGEGTYMIGAPDENGSVAPQMLLIGDGDGSWQWPTERTRISEAYPDFVDWVGEMTNSTWIHNPVETKVTRK